MGFYMPVRFIFLAHVWIASRQPIATVSDEHDERFHRDITLKYHYQGRFNPTRLEPAVGFFSE